MSAAAQNNVVGRPFERGQSGNPGGLPKGLRQLQATITLAHGYKVLTALQRLFEMGMDESTRVAMSKNGEAYDVPNIEPAVRAACLTAFVTKVGALTGLEAVARAPEQQDQGEGDGALFERVAAAVVRRAPDLVAAQLKALPGGKP